MSTTGPGPSSNPIQIDVTGLMLRNEITLKHWGLTSGRLEVEVLRPDGKRFATWDAEGSYAVEWVAR